MKKSMLLTISLVSCLLLWSQMNVYFRKTDGSILKVYSAYIDSIRSYKANASDAYYSTLSIFKKDNSVVNLTLSEIDSMFFAQNDTVKITYTGSTVNIDNPLAYSGVSVSTSGQDVTVTSSPGEKEVIYLVSGTTTNGMLKIYSDYKLQLLLNNANITNGDGPAINIQSSKKISVNLLAGTQNTLTDGSSYATSTEDQKATFFSEGQLIFDGTGSLTVKSNSQHGICSDDFIQITNGVITVSAAAKDGIHANDYFKMYGGTLNVTATSDDIDCEAGHVLITGGSITTVNTTADTKGISCDSTMTISGGTINMTVGGNQAKGLKSKQAMTLSGGTITINTSGAAVLSASGSGYDPSYCTAIKGGSDITISGANITVRGTGTGAKGISADGNLSMTSGTVGVTTTGAGATYTNTSGIADSYASSCFEADGNISIFGGSLTATTSGTASKGISADGTLTFGNTSSSPTVNVTNTGTKLLVSGTANYTTATYSEPKCIKSDGVLTINNGTFTLSASQQGTNVIDCDDIMNITGGTIGITMSGNQTKGLKATGNMNLTGGTVTITASGALALENVAAATYDPSYCTAIKGSSIINIGGSNITITHTGAGGKGISGDGNINITSGTVKITTSGNGSTYVNSSSAKDAYSAACITTDANLSITGGMVTCSSSGTGGKGFSVTGTITIGTTTSSPTINLTTTGSEFIVSSSSSSTGGGPGGGSTTTYDYCHPKTIVSTGAITINNGTNTISSTDDGIHSETSITINGGSTIISNSVEGIESLLITMNGGYLNILASDDAVNGTAGTVSGGTETTDASYIYMKGGTLVASATNGDAVDCNGNFTMTGGTLLAYGPANSTNEDIDVNGNILINGGLFFGACYNSSMFETITSSSTQTGVCLKSSSQLSTGSNYFHIQNASGTDLGTFMPPRGAYYYHFSSPSLTTSTTYTVYIGGSYSNATSSLGGYYTGGTYSNTNATKKTFTTGTSKITTVNSF